MSLRNDLDDDQVVQEYISQKFSAGNLYTTETFEMFAAKKYNLSGKPTLYISNGITGSLKPRKMLPKLSKKDGAIHCVYAGSMATKKHKDSYRYYDEIFEKMVGKRVYIHFYTHKSSNYKELKELENISPYIHCEGSLEYHELMEQLTQYDVGLCFPNKIPKNEFVLSLASANKMYEYVHAGLPIAVNNLPDMVKFIDKCKCGKILDLEGDIYNQLYEISNINISPTLLEDNGLLLEQQIDRLTQFYQDVILYYRDSH
jgi:hypothetical protein